LILNRRYFELEDNMKLEKENYEQEVKSMKVQFGKDLNLVHLDNKKALALQRKDMADKHIHDVVHLKNQLGDQFKKLKADFEEQLKKINKEKIEERVKKENYFSELKKQKNETTGLYQGAFGTFSIAFENPLHTKLAKCQ
jgi:GTP cyclohydrolase II